MSYTQLDSNFNKVWCLNTGPNSQYTGLNSQLRTADDNYVAVGEWYNEADTSPVHKYGWLLKYSETGQIIWNRLYQGINSNGMGGDENVLSSMSFFSDNSIIAADHATDFDETTNSEQAWLLHLDSAGCLPDSSTCGITDGIVTIPQAAGSVRAYPDPASDHIRFDVVLDRPSGYTLHISDLLGQAVSDVSSPPRSSTTDIDVRSWSPGLYLYRLTSGYGFATTGRFIVSH